MSDINLIPISKDPLELFGEWFLEAENNEGGDHDAMALATSTIEGAPSVRMVLLKDYSAEGFVFYTNKESRKGRQINSNKNAALCFYWKKLKKQVRVEGLLSEVNAIEADNYFESRSRDSQIAAWASFQSKKLSNRSDFLEKISLFNKKFDGIEVPRPDFWTGFCLSINMIEFWLFKLHRTHDRVLYTKKGVNWKVERLYP